MTEITWKPMKTAPRNETNVLLLTTTYGVVEAYYAPLCTYETMDGPDADGAVWVCADDQFQIEVEEFSDDNLDIHYHDGEAIGWLPRNILPIYEPETKEPEIEDTSVKIDIEYCYVISHLEIPLSGWIRANNILMYYTMDTNCKYFRGFGYETKYKIYYVPRNARLSYLKKLRGKSKKYDTIDHMIADKQINPDDLIEIGTSEKLDFLITNQENLNYMILQEKH